MKQISKIAKNHIILTSALLLILCSAIVLAPWLKWFHASSISADPSDWGVFGDYVGGVLSTIISALGFLGIIATIKTQSEALSTQLSAIVQEKEIRDDEVYSKQSLECLNEAYAKLLSPDGGLYKNRIAWLECARLIVTAQNLADKIRSDSMRYTYKAAEKVIRSKFSTILNPDIHPETMQPSYFCGMDWARWQEGKGQEPIEKASVYIIYKFSSWQSDEPDEMDSIKDTIDFKHINRRYFGARHFLEHGASKD